MITISYSSAVVSLSCAPGFSPVHGVSKTVLLGASFAYRLSFDANSRCFLEYADFSRYSFNKL